MCLTLVAMEKYPFTDQRHFTSGAHWKGRECDIQGRAPLSFCFSTKSRTGYRAPVVPKPEPGESDAPASGCQDGQLSLLAPSTLITVEGRRAWPSSQSGGFQKTTDEPQGWNWKVIIFLTHEQKQQNPENFSPRCWHLAPYLLLSSLKTSNSAEFLMTSLHGKTSGTGFIVLTGEEKTEQTLSVAGWQSASDRCPAQWPTWPNPSHPDPFRCLLAGNFTSSPPNGRWVVWYFLCSDFFVKILPCKSR